MRVPKYVSESPELLAARAWEEETGWETVREAEAGRADRMKDMCKLDPSAYAHEACTPACWRCGVPLAFSHAFDAKEVA